MLFVLVPVADILASISMFVDAESLSHIVHELTFVKVAGCVVQLTPTVVEIVFPKALVDGAIRPSHYAITLFNVWGVLQHLPGVDGALFGALVDCLVVDIHEVTRFIVVHVFVCDLVAVVQPLSSIVTSKLRFNLYVFLPRGGVVQQSVIHRSLPPIAVILILIV